MAFSKCLLDGEVRATSQWITASVVLAALTACGPSEYRPPVDKAALQAALDRQEQEKRRTACQRERDSIISSHAALMKEKKYWLAARSVRDCHRLLNDGELARLVATAEVKEYVTDAQNSKGDPVARLTSLEALLRDYPTEAAPFAARLAEFKRAAEREQARREARGRAAELAKRRSEGVSIGMTQEEVLQSNWGRPRRVNKTTNAGGTSEQWVYDGGYLYFEGDRLMTIQH